MMNLVFALGLVPRRNGEPESVSLLVLTVPWFKREFMVARERKALNVQVARHVAYLKTFDDRILADIGLNRSEIEAYVRSRLEAEPEASVRSARMGLKQAIAARRNI